MKKIQNICLVLLVVLVSSCYTSKYSYKQLSSVHKGMTQAEVIAVFGDPSYRSFNDDGEMLEFRDLEYSASKTIKIWFVNDRVTEMKSYYDHNPNDKYKKEETIIVEED